MESLAIVFVWTIQNKFVTSLAWHALSVFPLRSTKNQSNMVASGIHYYCEHYTDMSKE